MLSPSYGKVQGHLSASDHHVKRIGCECEKDAATFQIEEMAILSEVFHKMEQLAKDEFESLQICNYSASQASLEQVRKDSTPIQQQILIVFHSCYTLIANIRVALKFSRKFLRIYMHTHLNKWLEMIVETWNGTVAHEN